MEVLASGWSFLFVSLLASLWVTDCQRGPAKLWADYSGLDWARPEIPKLCCSLEGHGDLIFLFIYLMIGPHSRIF